MIHVENARGRVAGGGWGTSHNCVWGGGGIENYSK